MRQTVKCTLLSFVSVMADLFSIVIRLLIIPAAELLRLVRLSHLRALTRGCIPVTTQFDGPVFTSGVVKLDLRDHCRLGRGVFLETGEQGRIEIGSHTRINAGVFIVAHSSVSIGDDCLIGEYVSIRDADHGTEAGELIRKQALKARPVFIGNDVWIGRGTVILKGITIGDGAVVGANSVVTSDIPPRSVAVGVPAKVKKIRATE